MNDGDLPESGFEVMEFVLVNAVSQIIKHEDFNQYMSWCKKTIPLHLATEFGAPDDDETLKSMTSCLGRAIWNATPLPGNNFRTKPLPKPGRNDKCPCGSGRKYKQCCSHFSREFEIDEKNLWPILLDKLPRKTLDEAIKQHRLPVDALIQLAEDYTEQYKTSKAVSILEPLFKGEIKKPDELLDFALNLLCNLYDELGRHKKKMEVLERIIDSQPRSPLRSGARQRLTAILMDEGNAEAAWETFQLAHQDDPESEHLGILEIQLLLSENNTEQAKHRADFWVRRLKKLGYSSDESPLDFFINIAKDPIRGMAQLSMDVTDGMGERLAAWLETQTTRPLPLYQVNEEPPEVENDEILPGYLQKLGISEQEIEASFRELEIDKNLTDQHDQGQHELFIDEDEDEFPEDEFEDGLFLVAPDDIRTIEEKWRKVFHLAKPFSVHDESFDDSYDPWESVEEDTWSTFLETHPGSFDSLEIIDDLATALNTHTMAGTPWLDKQVLAPLLERAAAIIDKSLNEYPDPKLHWIFNENRSALRTLARLIMHYYRNGEDEAAYKLAKRLLCINPGDNHGFRDMLINHYLRCGDDTGALSLANNYPDDMMVEISFGRVLALYRLGQQDEALTALEQASKMLPKVLRYLTNKRVRKPKLETHGVMIGGDDQAWLYREQMLEIWQATPDIIDWLKKAGKHL